METSHFNMATIKGSNHANDIGGGGSSRRSTSSHSPLTCLRECDAEILSFNTLIRVNKKDIAELKAVSVRVQQEQEPLGARQMALQQEVVAATKAIAESDADCIRLKNKLPYLSRRVIVASGERLQQQLRCYNYRPREEQLLLDEINKLRRSLPALEEYRSKLADNGKQRNERCRLVAARNDNYERLRSLQSQDAKTRVTATETAALLVQNIAGLEAVQQRRQNLLQSAREKLQQRQQRRMERRKLKREDSTAPQEQSAKCVYTSTLAAACLAAQREWRLLLQYTQSLVPSQSKMQAASAQVPPSVGGSTLSRRGSEGSAQVRAVQVTLSKQSDCLAVVTPHKDNVTSHSKYTFLSAVTLQKKDENISCPVTDGCESSNDVLDKQPPIENDSGRIRLSRSASMNHTGGYFYIKPNDELQPTSKSKNRKKSRKSKSGKSIVHTSDGFAKYLQFGVPVPKTVDDAAATIILIEQKLEQIGEMMKQGLSQFESTLVPNMTKNEQCKQTDFTDLHQTKSGTVKDTFINKEQQYSNVPDRKLQVSINIVNKDIQENNSNILGTQMLTATTTDTKSIPDKNSILNELTNVVLLPTLTKDVTSHEKISSHAFMSDSNLNSTYKIKNAYVNRKSEEIDGNASTKATMYTDNSDCESGVCDDDYTYKQAENTPSKYEHLLPVTIDRIKDMNLSTSLHGPLSNNSNAAKLRRSSGTSPTPEVGPVVVTESFLMPVCQCDPTSSTDSTVSSTSSAGVFSNKSSSSGCSSTSCMSTSFNSSIAHSDSQDVNNVSNRHFCEAGRTTQVYMDSNFSQKCDKHCEINANLANNNISESDQKKNSPINITADKTVFTQLSKNNNGERVSSCNSVIDIVRKNYSDKWEKLSTVVDSKPCNNNAVADHKVVEDCTNIQVSSIMSSDNTDSSRVPAVNHSSVVPLHIHFDKSSSDAVSSVIRCDEFSCKLVAGEERQRVGSMSEGAARRSSGFCALPPSYCTQAPAPSSRTYADVAKMT